MVGESLRRRNLSLVVHSSKVWIVSWPGPTKLITNKGTLDSYLKDEAAVVINAYKKEPCKSPSINYQKALWQLVFLHYELGLLPIQRCLNFVKDNTFPNIQQVKAKGTISVRRVPFMLQNVWMV